MLTTAPEPASASRPPAEEPVIRVSGLVKRYGDTEALRGVDLEVRRGEVLAFLGPNGAGKTTIVEILEGFVDADGGSVEVLGQDPAAAPRAWRDRVGMVLQESAPEPELTVRECLELYAGWYAAPRPVDDVLALSGLEALAGRRATLLSGGERRRLDVALALVGDPELIFLDEPTTGFDPAARRAAWEVIDGLRALGVTVFLTTHDMAEAERLADRIVVLVGGCVVATGTPATLGARHRAAARIVFGVPADHPLPAALAARAALADGRATLRSADPAGDLAHVLAWALDGGLDLSDLEVARPTLEDAYLDLVTPTTGSPR